MEEFAVETHIHSDIKIRPVPAVAHVVLWEAVSLNELPLRNATREEQGRRADVNGMGYL